MAAMKRAPDIRLDMDSEDNRRPNLKRLVENYATRTRELSEALATLGSQITVGKPFHETIAAIKSLRLQCDEIGGDLLATLEPNTAAHEDPPSEDVKP